MDVIRAGGMRPHRVLRQAEDCMQVLREPLGEETQEELESVMQGSRTPRLPASRFDGDKKT